MLSPLIPCGNPKGNFLVTCNHVLMHSMSVICNLGTTGPVLHKCNTTKIKCRSLKLALLSRVINDKDEIYLQYILNKLGTCHMTL